MTGFGGRAAKEPKKPLVVIPVYNERRSVRNVLSELFRHYDGEVLAVDDGSTDGTAQELARFPGVQVLRHATNLGYGRALRDGFEYAIRLGHDVVVTMDCDEQHEPAQVPVFLERLAQTDADIISGSRYLKEPTAAELQHVPPERRHINSLITNLLNTLCGWQLTDAFCGFKAYRVDALRRLRLDEDGYGFPLQLWLQAWQAGLRIEELAVPLIYKPNFERSFGRGLDDTRTRLSYYLRVIGRELEQISRMNALSVPACNCKEQA
ncbi:MAG: glycosyltransferase family 2 protein [Limnochordales bacterium]|nr:glycosyltransferase family 2 protein [Limnochordales bacterium]